MRFPLRWKILLITVVPLVALVTATLWTVDRSVTRRVTESIQDDLRRSSAAFESMLSARSRALSVEGQVIAQDPKFFSVLTLPAGADDPQIRATVTGVARDFDAITGAQVFEVLDPEGRAIASVGRESLTDEARHQVAVPALAGRPFADVVVSRDAHFQVSVTPVFAGGRVVGALILGARIGSDMAEQFRLFTRSEVSFLAGGTTTISTLASPADLAALRSAIARRAAADGAPEPGGTLFEARSGDDVWLTLWRSIPQTPRESGHTYVMQRSLRAETAALRELRGALLRLGGIAAIVALLVGFVIARSIVAPVGRLVRGAEEMERGNYDYPLEVRTHDEIGYLGTRFDEMRRQQRTLVQSLQDLARLKSEFIAVASHELRTPISIIKGFQELMSAGSLGAVSERQTEALRAIRRSTETLARIAENATRMAQLQGADMTLERAEAEIGPLVHRALEAAAAPARERHLAMSVKVEPGTGSARVDAARLEVALGHLVSNAIRFTPDGGRVEIHARRDAAGTVISVRDSGVGIAPERRAHLFDRAALVRDSLHHHSSSTLEFDSAGLGLGLSIARGIVVAHGGTIDVESAVGAGSTFTVRLPDHDEPASRAA